MPSQLFFMLKIYYSHSFRKTSPVYRLLETEVLITLKVELPNSSLTLAAILIASPIVSNFNALSVIFEKIASVSVNLVITECPQDITYLIIIV